MFLSCSSSFYPQRDSLATSSTAVRPPCFGSHFMFSLWFSHGPRPVSPASVPCTLVCAQLRRPPSTRLPACIPFLAGLQPQSLLPSLSCPWLFCYLRFQRLGGLSARPSASLLVFLDFVSLCLLCSVWKGLLQLESAHLSQHAIGRLLGGLDRRPLTPGTWPAPFPPSFTLCRRCALDALRRVLIRSRTCHEVRRWLFKETSLFI